MRNLTNTGGDIFVNTMFGGGEATEIVQQSFNTQALVNVAMKANTTQATSLNDTDILIIADGATGKVIQYITIADFKTAGTLWSLNGNQLYPDSQNYNVVVGTSNGANSNNYGVYVLDKDIAIKTSAGSGSSQGLRIINDTNSVNNYVDSAGDMFWAGATNDYNFDKQVIINTTGAELSNGTNTYTLPSSNGTLALVSQLPAGEWTLSNTQLYPNSTGTHLVVGTTTNPNNRELYVNGDIELLSNLYFNNANIYIDSNSQNLRNYADYLGGQHLFYVKQSNGIHTEVGSIRTGGINNIGNANVNSGKNVISLLTGGGQYFKIENAGTSGGSPYVDFQGEQDGAGGTSDYYFKWSIGTSGSMNEYMRLGTTGLTGSNLYWRANKIGEIYGGTNQNTYTTGDILYASASNTLSKLSIGTAGKILKVVGGVPAWATESSTDLTTATNFGTAVAGGNTIKLGNSAGTNQTTNLELYTSATLKIYNTSNVNVATFTPVSNTCNLDLKGGLLTTFTASTNAVWNGGTIAYNYGGTGVNSLSGQNNKALVVNANANGYTFATLPTQVSQYWNRTTFIGGSELEPVNTDFLSLPSGKIMIGTSSEHYALITNFTNNTFNIEEQDGTNVFKYDADNGYIDWCDTAGARMDFKSYVLHGSGTAYPSGVNMPFGTLGTIYGSSAYIRSHETDEVRFSEFQASPATTSSSMRCKKVGSSAHLYTTGGKLELSYLYGNNSTQNYIFHNSTYGFGFYGTNYSGRSYNIYLQNSGSGSNYGWIGCDSEGLFLHMNGMGDAMSMYSENSKACMRINNALRIDGFISTAGNNLTGNQTDGTCLSTNYFKPYSNSYWAEFAGNSSGFPYWDLWGTDYDPGNINSTGVGLVCERGCFVLSIIFV